MLSKLALLLLGFIAERPLNPYEIKKLFAHLNVDRWFPIGSSSIYAAIKALVKKDYVAGEKIKSCNMPEKTIYSITAKGGECSATHAPVIFTGARTQFFRIRYGNRISVPSPPKCCHANITRSS